MTEHYPVDAAAPLTTWSGTYAYRARALHRPSTLDELRAVVASRPRLRVLGSRHSFSDIADADELVSLDDLPPAIEVDATARTVSCSGAVRYGTLAEALKPHGLALANLASLPHISVAGAVATATHGSGVANKNLATAVAAMQIVTSDGDVVELRRGDERFDGAVVGLGALGAVTRVTLDVEPAYEVRQRVFEGLAWDALTAHLDDIMAAGYSVSVFTRWAAARAGEVWVKSRVTDEPEVVAGELFGAVAASVERHPILELDPVNCTAQLGRPGAWADRLPHFRMGFTPSSGAEIQSEYFVDRADALAAIDALRAVGPRLAGILQVAEVRTIAADDLWMSPQHGRDSLGLHFTWQPDPGAVARAVDEVEDVLLGLGARPHWGKVFHARADVVAPHYERLTDFAALAGRLDQRGAFRNAWLERVLGDAFSARSPRAR